MSTSAHSLACLLGSLYFRSTHKNVPVRCKLRIASLNTKLDLQRECGAETCGFLVGLSFCKTIFALDVPRGALTGEATIHSFYLYKRCTNVLSSLRHVLQITVHFTGSPSSQEIDGMYRAVSCGAVFSASSASTLGTGSSCQFSSESSLKARRSNSAILVLGVLDTRKGR